MGASEECEALRSILSDKDGAGVKELVMMNDSKLVHDFFRHFLMPNTPIDDLHAIIVLFLLLGEHAPVLWDVLNDVGAISIVAELVVANPSLPALKLLTKLLNSLQDVQSDERKVLTEGFVGFVMTCIAKDDDLLPHWLELFLALNNPFQMHTANPVMNAIASSRAPKVLGEELARSINRNVSQEESLRKLLIDVFSHETTANALFLVNDLKVVMEVLLREVAAVDDDSVRLELLMALHFALLHCHVDHVKKEVGDVLRSLIGRMDLACVGVATEILQIVG